MLLRLIRVDHENYSVLRLTATAREVFKGERRVQVRQEVHSPAPKRASRRPVDTTRIETDVGPENDAVFKALRSWRADVAREHGVPAYTIFHDKTLHEISRVLPRSVGSLHAISGVGVTKLERYGSALLEIVNRAVAD